MKEFVFIVRLDELPEEKFSPEELNPLFHVWESWIDGLIAKDIFVSRGNRLGAAGRVVKKGKVITNGPYAEIKEIIGGYFIIRANSIDEAAEIAKGAPIIGNGNIEIRSIYDMNE
ncbi:MAG TPA: YciI family protein [Mucilaginibacter sp.]|nr:YciI family protein [Mucilaginibacter sp.]